MSRVRFKREPKRSAGEGDATITLQNKRLRDGHRAAWWEADAIQQYWRVRLDLQDAVARVQMHDLSEGDHHPPQSPDERWGLLANWREALVQQLLTAAPDVAAVNWKRKALARGQHKFTDVKTERIERAIVEDVAFLDAHPTRTKKCSA